MNHSIAPSTLHNLHKNRFKDSSIPRCNPCGVERPDLTSERSERSVAIEIGEKTTLTL